MCGPLGVMCVVMMRVLLEAVLEPSLSKQVGLCVCVCVCVCVFGGREIESRYVHMCGPLGVMCVVMMVFPEAVCGAVSLQTGGFVCVCVCVCVCVFGGGG